jgi:hypothetical protein
VRAAENVTDAFDDADQLGGRYVRAVVTARL